MMAAIDIPDEVVLEGYMKVWKRKARFCIMKGNEDHSKVEIEHIGERDATFE